VPPAELKTWGCAEAPYHDAGPEAVLKSLQHLSAIGELHLGHLRLSLRVCRGRVGGIGAGTSLALYHLHPLYSQPAEEAASGRECAAMRKEGTLRRKEAEAGTTTQSFCSGGTQLFFMSWMWEIGPDM
jgi:hypothetical protein